MKSTEATRSASGLLPSAPTPAPGGLDRDLAFAEAERRLLGMELRPVTLDRFVVLHRLGQGAMGVVYAAHDPKLDRKVALKLVDTSGFGSEGVSDAQARIEAEARAAADLAHPNVVTIYDTGTVGDQVFLAMEMVDGSTLRGWLQPERSWREIVSLFIEAGRGLAAAHDKGVVHRDFKPDNVLVGHDGRPRVVDFGLARPVLTEESEGHTTEADGESAVPPGTSGSGRATRSRYTSIAGTPAYMAPEQFEGRNVGPHSDQFGFCVALYEALLGERPFAGKTTGALGAAVLAGKRRPVPRGHGLPATVLAAVLRGLQTEPGERYRSMHHLIGALQRARDARKRRALAVGGTLVLVGSVAGTYAVAQTSAPPPVDPCEAAEVPIEEVWNDDRRDRIATAQAGTDAAASGAWAGIEPKLDRLATRWGAMRRQACEDARGGDGDSALVLELRYACLDRVKTRLDALAQQLEDPTFAAAQRGPAAADDIARLDACEDREQLVATLHVNGLADSSSRSRLADGLERWKTSYEGLARADMLYVMGERKAAKAEVRAVVERAKNDGLRTIEAEGTLMLGRWGHDRDALEQALSMAIVAGTPTQAAEVAITLAESVDHPKGLDPALARQHLRYAQSFLDRLSPDQAGALRVRVPAVEGLVALREQDPQGALDRFEAALTLAEQTLPPDHTDPLTIRGNQAKTLKQLGQTERAAEVYAGLLEQQVRVLGRNHPHVAQTAFNLGVIALEERRLDDAQRHFAQAREARTLVFGEEHFYVSGPLSALGEVHRLRGELAEAEPLQAEALRIREEVFDRQHPALRNVLDELGEIALAQGRLDVARGHFERSLAIGRAHPDGYLPATLTKLGRARAASGDRAEALALLEEALTLRSGDDVDPIKRAETEVALARVLHAEDPTRARTLAEAGLGRLRASGRRPQLQAEAERWFAEAFGAANG